MKKTNGIIKHKVVTFLGKAELEFLEKLGNDALFSTGRRLTYNDILKSLVDLAMEMGISGEGVKTPKEFTDKFFVYLDTKVKGLEKDKSQDVPGANGGI